MTRFPQGRKLNYLLSVWCKPSWFALIPIRPCPEAVTRLVHSLRQRKLVTVTSGQQGFADSFISVCVPLLSSSEVLSQQQGTPEVTGALQVWILPQTPLWEAHVWGGGDWLGSMRAFGGGWGSKCSDLIIIYSQRHNDFNYSIKSTECRAREWFYCSKVVRSKLRGFNSVCTIRCFS